MTMKNKSLSEKIGKDRGIFCDVDVLRVIDVKEFIKDLKKNKRPEFTESPYTQCFNDGVNFILEELDKLAGKDLI